MSALSGLYANIPPPSSVAAGSTYTATDLGVEFVNSTGTWQPNLGAVAAFAQIAAVTLTAAGPVTFSNIPQVFNHLRLVALVRSATNAATDNGVYLRFNGDATADYDFQATEATGSATPTASYNEAIVNGYTSMLLPGATAPAAAYGLVVTDVPFYTDAAKKAEAFSTFDCPLEGSGMTIGTVATHWRQTAAVTSLTVLPAGGSFAIGSALALYGEL